MVGFFKFRFSKSVSGFIIKSHKIFKMVALTKTYSSSYITFQFSLNFDQTCNKTHNRLLNAGLSLMNIAFSFKVI